MSEHLLAEKKALLEAALVHVPFDGWGWSTLERAAQDADLTFVTAKRAFPGGATEVVAFFISQADEWAADELGKQNLEAMKIRERIATGVKTRLLVVEDHREAVRRGIGTLMLPGLRRRKAVAKSLWGTADMIWRAAGDTSTDFNYYTKRSLLIGVYVSTLAYWLADKSEGYAETWAFLDRRIEDVMQIQKLKNSGPLTALRNIAGRFNPQRIFEEARTAFADFAPGR